MSRRFQFSLGCLVWLVAVVSLIIGTLRNPPSTVTPKIVVAALAVVVLVGWGAALLSKEVR